MENTLPLNEIRPFSSFDLDPDLLAGLAAMGYTHPTPVQEASIPAVSAGKDLMVQALTGTGKTLAFGLPALHKIDRTCPDTQVLVILPTRELALQVADELARVGERLQIIVAAVFGGVKLVDQIDKMQWAPVVVGTPGRLRDHIERGYLHLDTCKVVVLDEADEMLDMGFKDDLEFILKRVPAEQRQTLLFSATFPPEIVKIAHRYMRDPERIEVSSGLSPAVGLSHKFARVPKDKKIQALSTLLKQDDVGSGLIFCETKVETAWVYQRLKREGFSIGILTGDIPQEKRLSTLQAFRDGELTLLVATDVAARGLDIPAVSHVFHFTVPRDTATYVHRSGRTARAGKKGTAFTLVTAEEERDFQRIMRDIKQAGGGRDQEAAGRGRAPGAPPAAAPARPAERGPRDDRGPREERGPRDDRNGRGERAGRGERGPREGQGRPAWETPGGPRPDGRPAGRPEGRPEGSPRPEGRPEGGQRPGGRWDRQDGRSPRFDSNQANAASAIFQAIGEQIDGSDPYQNLADALLARRDAGRLVAALLGQAAQAADWIEASRPMPPAPIAPPTEVRIATPLSPRVAPIGGEAIRPSRTRSTRKPPVVDVADVPLAAPAAPIAPPPAAPVVAPEDEAPAKAARVRKPRVTKAVAEPVAVVEAPTAPVVEKAAAKPRAPRPRKTPAPVTP